jgi:hypothetical protein
MSRWVYLLGVGLALVALALAVTDAAMGPEPGVTEANLARVRGLTLAEVEALMGVPSMPGGVLAGSGGAFSYHSFFGRERVASVLFDRRGRAVSVISRPFNPLTDRRWVPPRPPGFWARLRATLNSDNQQGKRSTRPAMAHTRSP